MSSALLRTMAAIQVSGEGICPVCSGCGKTPDGKDCPNCGGSGRVIEGIGGG